MTVETARPPQGKRLEDIRAFLRALGLDWDEGVEFTVCLTENGRIIATGSRQGQVLKCVGVDPARQGEGLMATLVAELVKDAARAGESRLYVFTKPENARLFGALGFYPVAQTAQAALLENTKDGVARFVAALPRPAVAGAGPMGAIVANCNPFTNGHLHLVQQAARACAGVYLFILSEERGRFPAADRLELASRGTAHLGNVAVCPTGAYMVSGATFPEYFIPDKALARRVNCALDLTIFAERFARPLGITRRYVGTEPISAVTREYNRQMLALLPPLGVEVEVVERCRAGDKVVSASRVRALLDEGRLEAVRPLVPPATFDYLTRAAGTGGGQ